MRFAPSPTGELHIGSVRTILYNYLFARQRGGRLVLRIEDTDQDRLVAGAIDSIYDGLHWLGIHWDEGPREKGPFAPYVQSERLPLYREHAETLLAAGHAYPCFCTRERLAKMRKEQEARGEVTRYDRLCRRLSPDEVRTRLAAGGVHTIRLKVPEEGSIGTRDLIHGERSWELRTLDDQVLLKSDGFPTYHLAVVVDDHVMRISHVLRGDEWFPSLPKHLLLYQAFGWQPPAHGHLPLVLGKDKKKLSKRHGSTAVREFREQGYLPEALVNFLALIGWAPPDENEVLTMEDLLAKWSLERCHDSPGIWDTDRLDYFDGIHIRRLSDEELADRLQEFLPAGAPRDLVRAAAPLVKERIKTLAGAGPLLEFLFTDELSYDPVLLVVKQRGAEETRRALERARRIAAEGPFTYERIGPELEALAEELGWKKGDFFLALRVALTGKRVTPPLDGSMLLLGRERTVARLDAAIERLNQKAPA